MIGGAPSSGQAATVNSFSRDAAACLGVAQPDLGVLLQPKLVAPVLARAPFLRSGSKARVIVVGEVPASHLAHSPVVLLSVARAVWESGTVSFPPDTSDWRTTLVSLLGVLTARVAGLGVAGGLPSLTSNPLIGSALVDHSVRQDCGFLARLRSADLAGRLSGSTVISALRWL